MKQIAIFSPNYSPELGACASRIQYLAERLKEEGHEVIVYTTFPNYPTGSIFSSYRKFIFKKIIQKEIINGIKIIRFSFYPSNSSSSFVRLFSMFTLSLSWLFAYPLLKNQRPDTILVQSPPLLPVFSVWVLSKILARKNYSPSLILNLSDLYPRVLLDLDKINLRKIKGQTIYNLLLSFEEFIYKKMDFIIGQSNEIVKYVRKIVPSTPTFLYRNGIKFQLFKEKESYQIKETEPIKLVYAGLLGVAQGIIEVLKNIDFEEIHAELHIYGNGNERSLIESFIKNKFSDATKKQTVFLYDAISSQQIAQKLANYDVAIILQKKQIVGTVPSKIYEAMAAGLPILLCGNGESASLIRKYDLGIVVKLEQNQKVDSSYYNLLRKEICNFKKLSSEKRKTFGTNGRKIAQTVFDKEIQFENIKDLFS